MAKRTKKTSASTTARKSNAGKTSKKSTRLVTSRSTVKAKSTTRAGTAVADPVSQPTFDQIRARAYEIYLARGRSRGDPAADWIQAERELRDNNGQTL